MSDDKPKGPSAFVSLDALPMLAKGNFKLVSYKKVDHPDGSQESAEITITGASAKSIVIRTWVRRVESDDSYTVFQHATTIMPNGAPPDADRFDYVGQEGRNERQLRNRYRDGDTNRSGRNSERKCAAPVTGTTQECTRRSHARTDV